MGEQLRRNDSNVQTEAPPVGEPPNRISGELPPEEIIKRLRGLPDRQGRLIEMVDAIRKANAS